MLLDAFCMFSVRHWSLKNRVLKIMGVCRRGRTSLSAPVLCLHSPWQVNVILRPEVNLIMPVFHREGSSRFLSVSQVLRCPSRAALAAAPCTTSRFNLVSCSSVLHMCPPGHCLFDQVFSDARSPIYPDIIRSCCYQYCLVFRMWSNQRAVISFQMHGVLQTNYVLHETF